MTSQILLPGAYYLSAFGQPMKSLSGRFKAEWFSRLTVEKAFDLDHPGQMDCGEVRTFRKEILDEPIRVLIHAPFPRRIRRCKENLRVEALRGFTMADKLFAVVIRDGVNMVRGTVPDDALWRDVSPWPFDGLASRWSSRGFCAQRGLAALHGQHGPRLADNISSPGVVRTACGCALALIRSTPSDRSTHN